MENAISKIKNFKNVDANTRIYPKMYKISGNGTRKTFEKINIDEFDCAHDIINNIIDYLRTYVLEKGENSNQSTFNLGNIDKEGVRILEYDFIPEGKNLYFLDEEIAIQHGIDIKKLESKGTKTDTVQWSHLDIEDGDKILIDITIENIEYEILFLTSGSISMGKKKNFVGSYKNSPKVFSNETILNLENANIIYIKDLSKNKFICKNLDRFRTHFGLNEIYIKRAEDILQTLCITKNTGQLGVEDSLLVLKNQDRFEYDYIQEHLAKIDNHFRENGLILEKTDENKYVIKSKDIYSIFVKQHVKNKTINPHTEEEVG
ncbi:hypothetical protein R2F61_05445 [Mollicutes bacterium LVI A0078]|nr:hypothetical protein RZE84_05465 [Mollicutes bacterium LVI A0075]WOO90174.1 hypothetical protein R2F61_05445 [Mollicutes bacterium LVI A0078]